MKIIIKENLRDTIRGIEDSGKAARKALPTTIFRALTLLEAQIKQNIRTRMNVRSGTLLNSVQKDIKINGDTIEGSVGPEGVPYAAIQEEGGTIPEKFVAPRNKLALKWESGGKTFFSKGHRIPSFDIKPKHYIKDAVEKLAPKIDEELGLFLEKELRVN